MKLLEKLDRSIVTSLDRFIDDTLNKVNGVNKPYKAIQRSEQFKKFEAMFTEGIAEQGKWASDNLQKLMDSAGIEDDLQPIALDQENKLKGLLKRDMPALDEYVTSTKAFNGLKDFFEYGVVQQYKRWGYLAKGAVEFTLSNTYYINQLKDRAAYLLNQSSLDDTTLTSIIDTVTENRLAGMTNAEVATVLKDTFDEVSQARGNMIARTESANAMGDANHASAKENGATTHSWVLAGGGTDELCAGNADDGEIPIDQAFSSGDLSEPAHPNCECYTEAGEIDLDTIELWTGE